MRTSSPPRKKFKKIWEYGMISPVCGFAGIIQKKMSILPKQCTNSVQSLSIFQHNFYTPCKNNSKLRMEKLKKKIQSSESNPDQLKNFRNDHQPWHQAVLQSKSDKNFMGLLQKQTHWWMESNPRCTNKSI